MDLVVRSGSGHAQMSDAYTLRRIIVDPKDGITFECLDKANRLVTVRPPKVVKDNTVEITPCP